MVGNIPGGNILVGNSPGVGAIHQGGVWGVGIFRVGVLLIPIEITWK